MKRCPLCHQIERRSNEANKRYWAVLGEIANQFIGVNGRRFSSIALHYYFRLLYLGGIDTKLPDGKVHTEPESTADLDQERMSEYITKIEHWCAENGIISNVG